MASGTRVVPLYRSMLFLLAIFLFAIKYQGTVHAMLPLCSDVCGTDTACSEECVDDSDNFSTCGDYNGGQSNGECAPNCSDVCGSGVSCTTACTGGPTCGDYNGGQVNGECYGSCGDNACQMQHEDCSTCSTDCGACPPTCSFGSCSSDPDCGGGGAVCNGGCCIVPCEGDDCDGHSRSCDDEFVVCGGSDECCDNEVCATADGGDYLCYQTSTT